MGGGHAEIGDDPKKTATTRLPPQSPGVTQRGPHLRDFGELDAERPVPRNQVQRVGSQEDQCLGARSLKSVLGGLVLGSDMVNSEVRRPSRGMPLGS